MAGGGDGGGVGGAGGGGGGAVGGAGGGGGGGAGGAGGGGGGDGGGGDDGLANRWCAHCRKAYECHQWWIDSHRPACQNLQEERARSNQRNLEQAQAKKLDKERRANKRRAKETSVKATASSKGKAQNNKRN